MDKWLAVLLKQIVTQVSPQIRAAMEEFIAKLDKDAKATANPWDDILVGLIKLVLAIK
jgi:hypothetical protein